MLRTLIIFLFLLFGYGHISQAQQNDFPAAGTAAFVSSMDVTAGVSFTDQNEPDERPLTARLSQNYPNPFNPVTMIAYRVPENSNVRIEVFDQLGRSVDVILNESRTAGEHELMYDASHLTSGVYIYRMELQGLESGTRQVFTRKFTLMK
jgi:hypothetical protein